MAHHLQSQDQRDETLERRITAEAFFVGVALVLIALMFRQTEIIFGIWGGTLISILNFKLLAKNTPGRFSQRKEKFYRFFLKFPLRYGIMAVILWLAVTKDFRFFAGMAIGLFIVRLTMYADTFFLNILEKKRRSGYGD